MRRPIEYGRIDRPTTRRTTYRVVVYRPDRVLSDHPDYASAADALQAYVAATTAKRSMIR